MKYQKLHPKSHRFHVNLDAIPVVGHQHESFNPRVERYKLKSVRRLKWQKYFKGDLNSEYANKCICHFNVTLDIFGCFNYILPSDIHSHQNTIFIQVYNWLLITYIFSFGTVCKYFSESWTKVPDRCSMWTRIGRWLVQEIWCEVEDKS